MPYSQIHGRRPFERASKIAHTEIVKNPVVQQFLGQCVLPAPPPPEELAQRLIELPPSSGRIRTVIAIDGGMNATWIPEHFPSALIAFVTLGPLLLDLSDLDELDTQTFIGPEDMNRLKRIQRYSLVVPTRAVRTSGCSSFSLGVRKAVQDFLAQGDGHLM